MDIREKESPLVQRQRQIGNFGNRTITQNMSPIRSKSRISSPERNQKALEGISMRLDQSRSGIKNSPTRDSFSANRNKTPERLSESQIFGQTSVASAMNGNKYRSPEKLGEPQYTNYLNEEQAVEESIRKLQQYQNSRSSQLNKTFDGKLSAGISPPSKLETSFDGRDAVVTTPSKPYIDIKQLSAGSRPSPPSDKEEENGNVKTYALKERS